MSEPVQWDVERLRRIYDTPKVGDISAQDSMYLEAYLRTVDNFDLFDKREEA